MAWNPAQYLKFGDERLRPGFDLLARVGELPPGPICELGCGTGAHARAIAARWPERSLTAIDSSAEMLAKASVEPSSVQWMRADIATWSAPEPLALIFSNATLHWLNGHERLFPHLLRQLTPGGVLAVQMPRNHGAPSHTLMAEMAREKVWASRLLPILREEPTQPPAFYYDLLSGVAKGGIDLWETEYLHLLQGDDAALNWIRGTALRPLLDALEPGEGEAFSDRLAAQLREAYPKRPDGRTLFPFRRLFLIAQA